MNATAGSYTGSELTGNCRLRWYDHLMRNMLAAPAEAEQFTRELHMAARERPRRAGPGVGHRGGEDGRRPAEAAQVRAAAPRPEQALEVIKQALTEAQVAYCAALAPLEQVGDPRVADVSGARALARRIRWATRWSTAARAGGSAT